MAGSSARLRRRILLLTALSGCLLFVWQLGSSGLVDETPPLFAASARGMVERHDWLIPHVNGLPRYDKPPLVYWLMGAIFALPGQSQWDPLGSWAACLPSALASVAVMLMLADTLMRWPQPGAAAAPPPSPRSEGAAPGGGRPIPPADGTTAAAQPAVSPLQAGLTAWGAALAYGLSPLVFAWGRISVSDAVFTALLSLSLILAWRTCADSRGRWWHPWPPLALAVLTKGPVAVVLLALTLLGFAWLQGCALLMWQRLRPIRGLLVCLLMAGPWYGLALLRDGEPFLASFFGYHNLQRFTSVVNHHLQPWWFFGPVLVVCSLPFTPLLLLGLARALGRLRWNLARPATARPLALSLDRFAAAWLLAVLVFFTLAATKLPSYWLPATPAAGLLIASAAQAPRPAGSDPSEAALAGWQRLAWSLTVLLTLVLAGAFAAAPLWVPLIQDPEMPELPGAMLASGRLSLAAICWFSAAVLGWWLRRRPGAVALVALQLPLLLNVGVALVPLWGLGDRIRALPVRQMAEQATKTARRGEALAMVGILKPSLHFYSNRVVIYEGNKPTDLINLAERLQRERRPGQPPSTPSQQPTLLLVIDSGTAATPWWRDLQAPVLARAGLYQLWRLDRRQLERRAAELRARGLTATWELPRPERY